MLASPTWRNLGPRTRGWLRELGLTRAEQLAQQDPVAIGLALRAAGHPFSLVGCYAIAGAQRDCDWRCLPEQLRKDLHRRWAEAVAESWTG